MSHAVYCERAVGESKSIVPDARCKGTKPAQIETCAGDSCGKAAWGTGSWQACSVPCGGGKSSRIITCYKPGGSENVTEIDSSGVACDTHDLQKPRDTRKCNSQACESFFWETGAWSACSAPCGGFRSRSIACKCAPACSLHKVESLCF
jgi:Thrombospondin type 1 domain